IYELCCGRPPFVGEGSGDVLAAHIHLPVPAMSTEVPAPVAALVRRLLAKTPSERFQTADAVIRAIDAVGGEPASRAPGLRRMASVAVAPSTTTLSGSAVMTAQHARKARLRWSVAAVSAGLAVVTVVIVTLAMRRGDDAGPVVTAAPGPPAAV